jgi:cell division protein FtsZ
MVLDLKHPVKEGGPSGTSSGSKVKIAVVGVGGAGGNAVNNMIRLGLAGVDFIAANTDAQALSLSLTENRLQLGLNKTGGLGCGTDVTIGRAAAEEAIDEIRERVSDYNMVFIAAGMGGGTGTGAAPIIAKIAHEQSVLTVGVATTPFLFEGRQRMDAALAGLRKLERNVDTLVVVPNQNLIDVSDKNTTFINAFNRVDDVLYYAVRGITDLVILPGLINLDFADVQAVIDIKGRAMMGTGEAHGEQSAINAAEAAIANPLLDVASIKGAKGVLINITGGKDMTLFEVDEAASRVRAEVAPEALTLFGSTFDETMGGKIRVSVVATGLASPLGSSLAKFEVSPKEQLPKRPPFEPREHMNLLKVAETKTRARKPASLPQKPAALPPKPAPLAPKSGPSAQESTNSPQKTPKNGPLEPNFAEKPEFKASEEPSTAKKGGAQGEVSGQNQSDAVNEKPKRILAASKEDFLADKIDRTGDTGNTLVDWIDKLTRDERPLPPDDSGETDR